MEPSTHSLSPESEAHASLNAIRIPAPPPPPSVPQATISRTVGPKHPFKTYKERLSAKQELLETEVDMTFSSNLKQATKDIQKLSDNLINAKFNLALTDDTIWHDGILAFYKIFKYLEDNLTNDLLPTEFRRCESFEKDLDYYYGGNWKTNYKTRESVDSYLNHLDEVRSKGSTYLFAYVFQMYMALMSSGQLLQQKRMTRNKLWPMPDSSTTTETTEPIEMATTSQFNSTNHIQIKVCPNGCAATYFAERIPVLKKKLRTIFNKVYLEMDDESRQDFVTESRKAFVYNMQVLKSLKGQKSSGNSSLFLAVAVTLGLFAILAYRHIYGKDLSVVKLY